MSDATAFLWRSELAGQPRDGAAWRTMYEYANRALLRPGSGLADLHVILAQAVMGEDTALDARARQMEDLAREVRYLAEIKQRLPDLPVMMVTAYGDEERRRLAAGYGAVEFITKPVDFDQLKAQLSQLPTAAG